MTALDDLRHAVAFHEAIYEPGGWLRVDTRKVDAEAAVRGAKLITAALVRALCEAPRGPVEQKGSRRERGG